MRIAVSGTHGSGKSTLVQDFAAAHPGYTYLPEPYELLADTIGEQPDAADFYRQLELSAETLRAFPPGARVIADRSPLDFLAYLLALPDLGRSRAFPHLDAAIDLAAAAMAHLDLLVVLPLDDTIEIPEDEDLDLREAMNDRLLDLIATDEYDLLGTVRVIEAAGSPRQRLAALERAIPQT
jgi:predicted ATPase